MKISVLTLALFFVIAIIHAQPDLDMGVPVNYSFYAKSDVMDGAEYIYYPGRSALFDPLYEPEMKKYAEAFITHVEEMRSVQNHIGPLGAVAPQSLGVMMPQVALKRVDDGSLKKLGHLYMRTDIGSQVKATETGAISLDYNTYIEDGTVYLGKDTSYTENLETGEMQAVVVDETYDYYDEVCGMGFTEEWEFDSKKARFEKEVKIAEIHHPVIDELTGDYRGMRSVFAFETGKFRRRYLSEEGLIKKNAAYQVLFNRGFSSNEEDMIEAVHLLKNAEAYGFVESTVRYKFLLEILASVKDGSASIYEYNPIDFDPEKLEKAQNASYFQALSRKDTAYMEDLMTGEMTSVVVDVENQLNEVVGIRFIEDWYVDAETMGFYKRVKGLVLLMEHKNAASGEVRGVKPYSPYYIKLNPPM